MNKVIYFLLCIFLFSCEKKEVECKCFNGIGSDKSSKPLRAFEFNNHKKVSICGYSEENLISEFNIFDCANGKSLVEYNAVNNCLVEFRNNELIIYETLMLPNNEHWYFNLEKISEQKIVSNEDELIVSQIKPLKIKPNIPENIQTEFLKNFNKLNLPTETKLNRLETLSLIGNKNATNILLQYEKNENLDGADKEYYDEIIERIAFRKKNGI